ncbi:MAG: HXXEE domain-containing protein [Propionibacteriaceae bacterium]|nr:HXXEE domain-containing protein [Propionibacteriaceae bacterium]
MSLGEQFWWAWPWMSLSMAMIMLILLFGTNLLRGGDDPRWRDPVWLAWLTMPTYLIHQFEEYALHITNGQHDIVTNIFSTGIVEPTGFPMGHFPFVNIALVWFGVPLGAYLCKRLRLPVLGFASYGFILLNGLLHLSSTLFGGAPISANPGFFTGTFIFVPLSILAIVVSLRNHAVGGRGIAVWLTSGIVAHLILFAGFAAANAGGAVAIYTCDLLVATSWIALSLLGNRALRARRRAGT